jgi:hypothetical protein
MTEDNAQWVRFGQASRSRLTRYDLGRFPGATLLDEIGRTLCEAECLPRKELFESWQMARRVARKLRGTRVVDLACGHALVGQLMMLLDPELQSVLAVDKRLPLSAGRVSEAMARRWPRLGGKISLEQARIETVALRSGDIVVCCHGCGALTDRVIALAIGAKVPVAVLPCCHAVNTCDDGGLSGWMDPALAIDVTRAARLRAAGYRVKTQVIPQTLTVKNRLLLAAPPS